MKKNKKWIGWLITIGILALVILVPILAANNTIYTKINFKELKNITQKEEFSFVYIGYASCKHCQNMQPALASIYKKYGEKIYYLDYSKMTATEQKELKALDPRLSTMGTPTFLFIKEGEIVGVKIGETDELEDLYIKYNATPVYYTIIDVDEFIEHYKSPIINALVIGKSNCSLCIDYKEVLNEVVYTEDINIYYLEYDPLKDADKNKIKALNQAFNSFSTPYTIITKNGKIIDSIKTYVDAEELISKLKENKVIE